MIVLKLERYNTIAKYENRNINSNRVVFVQSAIVIKMYNSISDLKPFEYIRKSMIHVSLMHDKVFINQYSLLCL